MVYPQTVVKELTGGSGTKLILIGGKVRRLKPLGSIPVVPIIPEKQIIKRGQYKREPGYVKTWNKRKERKKRTDFTRKGFKVQATKDGITYGPCISINELEKLIPVSKSQISKILRGDSNNGTGYIFEKL